MSRLSALLALTTLVLPSAGCSIFFGDDDCDSYYGGAEADPALSIGLRNPYSGQCEAQGGGGGGYGGCGDYDQAPEPDREAPQDWAICYDYCESLNEESCLAASACRAIYVGDCPEGLDCGNTTYAYFGCWGTAPSGPIQGGGCAGLDAYQCSRHDDCVANHYPSSLGCGGTGGDCDPTYTPDAGNFESCADEPIQQVGCFEDWECGAGQKCNAAEVCLPSPYACDNGANGDALVPCDDRCYGYCIPDDVNPDPGNCYDQAACDEPPPACPDGTIAGVLDGCWSGYCIPVADCEAPPACSDNPTEQACIARSECAPIYEGIDCTCDDMGNCTCTDWVYRACEDA